MMRVGDAEFYSTKETGESLGIHPDAIRRQINHGKIQSLKFGHDHLVSGEEIQRYRREKSVRGRKAASST